MDDARFVNVFQGSFYSTAFRVQNEHAFARDPEILKMQRRLDMFAGERDGVLLHCFASKDTQPKTTLQVLAPAILGLLSDARSDVVMKDPLGWIRTLQRHLHPQYGVVIDETTGNERFMTYVRVDCAGWTRKKC